MPFWHSNVLFVIPKHNTESALIHQYNTSTEKHKLKVVWEHHNWGGDESLKLQPQCCRGVFELSDLQLLQVTPLGTPGCCLQVFTLLQNWPLPQQLLQHCGLRNFEEERMAQNPALPWFYLYVFFMDRNSGLNIEIQSLQSILIQLKYNKIGINGNHCFTYQVALHSHNVSACCWSFWLLEQIFSCDIFYNKFLMFIFSYHLLLDFWEPPTLALVNLLSKNSFYISNKIYIYKKNQIKILLAMHI